MTELPPLRSAALALMQQNMAVQATQLVKNGPADAILSALDDREGKVGMSAQPGQIEAALSESIFSVNHKDVTKMKLDLIERTGEELGVDMHAYESAQDYAAAMRRVVKEILRKPNGEMALKAVERKLNLDDLGLSIKDVINAASDPDGDGGDKVEKALAEYYGIREDQPGEEGKAPLLVQTDEAGLYGLALA